MEITMKHKCVWKQLRKGSKIKVCDECGAIYAPGGVKSGQNTITISPTDAPNAIELDNTTTPPSPVANTLRIAGEGGATGRVMHIDLSSAPVDNQALAFSAVTGKWRPATIPGAGAVTGTGVPTRVAFWDTSTSITSDPNLNWDNTNKRLSLGTQPPFGRLHVSGVDTGNEAMISLQNTTAATGKMYGIRSSDTGELIIKDETAGVDRYRITSAGNLVMAQNNDIIPSLDNQGRIGTDTNRFASVRAVTITSGDFKFDNGYYLTEDHEEGGIKLCRPDGTTVARWK
jgi:hypothetical protein